MSRLARVAWSLPAVGVIALTWAVITPTASSSQNARVVFAVPQTAAHSYPAESLGRVVAARDLFRATRRPALTTYDPIRAAQPLVEPLPKPTLVLVGIVAGPDPTAVIDGFPGTEGSRVVRVGDVVAALRVRSIGPTSVRITGMDTVWTLTVREPWRN